MRETEVKILEVDKKEVISKLKSLGAKKVFEGKMSFSFFDFKNKKLESSRIRLRLRKEGKNTILTLKKSVSKEKAKIAEETEIEVSNINNARKILLLLGLHESKTITKQRTSFCLKNVKFEIDKYPGIPAFLEIESDNVDTVKEYVKKMGFSMKDAKPWSMKDLFKYYKKD